MVVAVRIRAVPDLHFDGVVHGLPSSAGHGVLFHAHHRFHRGCFVGTVGTVGNGETGRTFGPQVIGDGEAPHFGLLQVLIVAVRV